MAAYTGALEGMGEAFPWLTNYRAAAIAASVHAEDVDRSRGSGEALPDEVSSRREMSKEYFLFRAQAL
jgi:hypothetical protein